MNLDQSQTMQIVILVVVLALILIPLNIYQNKVGKNLALTITVVVLLGGAFCIYYIMDKENDGFGGHSDSGMMHDGPMSPHDQMRGNHRSGPPARPPAGPPARQLARPPAIPRRTSKEGPPAGPRPRRRPRFRDQNPSRPGPRPVERFSNNNPFNNPLLPSNENLWENEPFTNSNNIDKFTVEPFANKREKFVNRNASLDLRSEPPNPRVNVSPWMNTSMDVTPQRAPLDP